MTTLNVLLNQAVLDFAELVKLDEKNWHDTDLIKAINRSRELDPTGVTTFLLIQGHLDEHIKEEKFSAKDIIENPEAFKQRVDYLIRVREKVLAPDTVAPREEFKDQIRHQARVMGVRDMAPIEAVLASPIELAYLRWSALKSAKDLESFQFAQGDPDELPLGVNGTIFEFWNVNSLLRLLQLQGTPGTTMCLIRDAMVFASYFVFAVKNGDLITVLTDRVKGAHPQFWKMTRNPGRSLERRWVANWFPYDLLEIDTDKAPKYWSKRDRTALVPVQSKMVALKKLADLPPKEFIWAVLTMSKINEVYGKKSRRLPLLGYTAEMVTNPNALVAKGSSLMRKRYQPLSLEPLTTKDVTADTLAPQLETKATRRNEWLVERFKDRVPQEVLNALGGEETQKLLGQKYKGLVHREKGDEVRSLKIETLSPTLFGTEKEIAADRLWIARRNQAEVINELAEAEFEREHGGVVQWVKEKLTQRLPYLVEQAARGVWMTEATIYDVMGFAHNKKDRYRIDMIVRQDFPKNRTAFNDAKWGWFSERAGQLVFGDNERHAPIYYRCAIIPRAAARIFTVFEPECPESLAELLGVPVSELPVWLQYWYSTEPYDGNCILDRLDPADWAIKNKWNDILKFRFMLCLSPRAFDAARKRLGLPDHNYVGKKLPAKKPLKIKW